MVTLKIAGNLPLVNVGNLCTTNYNCAMGDLDISPDFKTNPFVTIKHSKPIDGQVLVNIASDNMSATVTIMPAINGAKMIAYELAQLQAFPPSSNIEKELRDEEAFKQAYELAASGTIVYQHTIAKGRLPVNGINGTRKLFFEAPSNKPDANEHSLGKTDYRELNKYVNVKAEQLLVRITPPTPGTPGLTVVGKVLPQVDGKSEDIEAGNGVRKNESGTEYYSTMDGYITYSKNMISVTPTIDIRDVDFGIGNIDFVGDINISGDVQPGFVVKGRNVFIGGICQDATVIAEENLVVKVGAKGSRSDTSLIAGGDITIGYCENYIVSAKGNVTVNKYAFNSELNCGRHLMAADSKSTVAGGRVIAFTGCNFYNLGTRANTSIEVIVGRKFDAEEKLNKINSEKTRLEQTLVKINEALSGLDLTNPNVLENIKVKKMVETRDLIVKRVALFDRRIDAILSDSVFADPRVEVHNEAQEGAVLKIHDIKYNVRSKLKKVTFFLNKAAGMIDYRSL